MPGCVESTHKGYNLHDPMLPPPSPPSAEDTGNGDARRWVRGTIAPVLREGRTLRPSMPSDVHSGSPAHGALVQRPPPFRARPGSPFLSPQIELPRPGSSFLSPQIELPRLGSPFPAFKTESRASGARSGSSDRAPGVRGA